MPIISFSVNRIQTLSICIKHVFPSNPYFSPYYLKMYISIMPLVNYFRILVISIKYFVQKVHVVKHFIRQFQRYLFLAKNFSFFKCLYLNNKNILFSRILGLTSYLNVEREVIHENVIYFILNVSSEPRAADILK